MNIYTVLIGCLFLCVAVMLPAGKKTKKQPNQVLISTLQVKSNTREFYIIFHVDPRHHNMGSSCSLYLIICFKVAVSHCLNSASHAAPGAALKRSSHVQGSDLLRILTGCGAHQGKPKIPPKSGISLISVRGGLNKSTPGLFRPVPFMQNWSGPVLHAGRACKSDALFLIWGRWVEMGLSGHLKWDYKDKSSGHKIRLSRFPSASWREEKNVFWKRLETFSATHWPKFYT